METFTLIVWLYIGLRYDEVRIEGVDLATCEERLNMIERSHYLAFQQKAGGRMEAKGQCMDANGVTPAKPTTRECASCGWDLPNRRRI